MKKENKKTFCCECREDVGYKLHEEKRTRLVKGKEYHYKTIVAYCKECDEEVNVSGLLDKDIELFDKQYRLDENLITQEDLKKLLKIYDIGKAPLSLALGFGEITLTRYFAGQIPSKRYSDIVRRALYDPKFVQQLVKENKEKITDKAYNKINQIVEGIIDTVRATSKIQVLAQYFIQIMPEVTPLALQKLLYFTQGLYFVQMKQPLFADDCEAWVHGPVYPEVYRQYRHYVYNPIDGNDSVVLMTDGGQLSIKEKAVAQLVADSFGKYSGKVLENITHREEPWIKARAGVGTIEYSQNVISKARIEKYFCGLSNKYRMNTKEEVEHYIDDIQKIS